jgi:hypothetical protein
VRAGIDVVLLTQDDSYSAVGIKEEGFSRNVGDFAVLYIVSKNGVSGKSDNPVWSIDACT